MTGTIVMLMLMLAVLSAARGYGSHVGSGRSPLALRADEGRDSGAAVQRLAAALAGGLGLSWRTRSHREQRVVLAGELDGRACELRVDAAGLELRMALSARLPSGVHLRREAGDSHPHVDLGYVRGEVPRGLVPTLMASCRQISRVSLVADHLELGRRFDVRELGDRPEQVVGFVKQALQLAERLERDFRRALV